MAQEIDLAPVLESLNSRIVKLGGELASALRDYIKKDEKEGYKEFGMAQQNAITSIFEHGVQQFYNAYTPIEYSRTGGLFKVLQMRTDENGVVQSEDEKHMDLYDPSRMHKDRKGGDLFDKVFVHGWHGGAASGPYHPYPGAPYYRTYNDWGRYGAWGRRAYQSKAPADIIHEELSEANPGYIYELFCEIMNEHTLGALQEFAKKEAPSIIKRYFR